MIQELLTIVLVLGAIIIVGNKAIKSFREFNRPDPCGGCGKSCEGCPISPRKPH